MALMHEKPERFLITGKRVVLRDAVIADANDRLACGRDPELKRLYGQDPAVVKEMTLADAQGWARKQIDSDNPNSWVIAVDSHSGQSRDRCIGNIFLHNLNEQDRCARLAIGIFNREYWGKGYGREAIRLVLRHAFHELGLHRIGLRVLAFNTRAIACYRACGFVVEGRERESCCIQGQWYDDVMMGILETEWDDCNED